LVKLNFGIKLVDNSRQIIKKILVEFRKQLRIVFPIALSELEIEVRNLIRLAIQSQPEYISLLGGTLQAELGVPDSEGRLAAIIDTYVQNIKVELLPIQIRGKTLSGKIIIRFDSQFNELLTLAESHYLTDRGEVIPWLRWLLIEGDLTITEYTFRTHPAEVVDAYSRTGLGLMFKTRGGRWSMPAEFVGTIGDNFITRAISSIRPELDKLSRNVLRGSLKRG